MINARAVPLLAAFLLCAGSAIANPADRVAWVDDTWKDGTRAETSPDTRFTLIATDSGTVVMFDWRYPAWDDPATEEADSLPGLADVCSSGVRAIAWAQDSASAWVGCGDGNLVELLIDEDTIPASITSGREPADAVPADVGGIEGITISTDPTGQILIFADDNNRVHGLDLTQLSWETGFQEYANSFNTVASDPSGDWLGMGGNGWAMGYNRTADPPQSPSLQLQNHMSHGFEDMVFLSNGNVWILCSGNHEDNSEHVISHALGTSETAWQKVLGGLDDVTAMDRLEDTTGNSLGVLVGSGGGDVTVVTDWQDGDSIDPAQPGPGNAVINVPDSSIDDVAWSTDHDHALALTSGGVTLLSGVPLVTIKTLTNPVLTAGETAELSFACDIEGDAFVVIGAEGLGNDASLGDSVGRCTSSSSNPVSISADDLSEGPSVVSVLVRDAANGVGHASVIITRDLPPEALAGFEVRSGNNRAFARWNSASDADLAAYTIWVSDSPFDESSLPQEFTVPGAAGLEAGELPAEGEEGEAAAPTVTTYPYDVPPEDSARAQGKDEFIIEGLLNGETYWVAMATLDSGGTHGALSEVVTVTPEPSDNVSGSMGDMGGCACAGEPVPHEENSLASSMTGEDGGSDCGLAPRRCSRGKSGLLVSVLLIAVLRRRGA